MRRFEQFTGAEVRTWWTNGTCRLITAPPDTPDQPPSDDTDIVPPGVAAAVAALRLPFVTVDLAQQVDSTWRIVELGDGQVSDRPSTTEPASLIAALRTDDGLVVAADPRQRRRRRSSS